MARKQGLMQAYDLADAEHVRDATRRHWKSMAAMGADAEELKAFEATINAAKKLDQAELEERPADQIRQELKDLVGDQRSAGDLVADGFRGQDPEARRALKLGGRFPKTDALILAYVQGVAPGLKKYSAKLAQRGFGKDRQERMVALARDLGKLQETRAQERGERSKAAAGRRAVFFKLRNQTRYFRRLGRRVLRLSDDRTDFDRVKVERPRSKHTDETKRAARKSKKGGKAGKGDAAGKSASTDALVPQERTPDDAKPLA